MRTPNLYFEQKKEKNIIVYCPKIVIFAVVKVESIIIHRIKQFIVLFCIYYMYWLDCINWYFLHPASVLQTWQLII